MKNTVALVCLLAIIAACSNKNNPVENTPENLKPEYDTVAVDSFSAGATSVDIMRNIRLSSQKYQDSLKNALKLQAEEEKIKKELEKEEKKKEEEEKKLKEKEKEAEKAKSSPTESSEN